MRSSQVRSAVALMSLTRLFGSPRVRFGASLGGLVLVGGAAFLAGRSLRAREGVLGGPEIGKELPRVVVLSEVAGSKLLRFEMAPGMRTTLIVFAIACQSCQAEWEAWNGLAGAYEEDVILLAYDQTFEAVGELLGEVASGTRMFLLDTQGRTLLGITSFPTIIRVDPNGKVSGVWSGPRATPQLEKALVAQEDQR